MKFKVSSFLKNIVGKDLITNDFVAIYELVKNAIDAQASNIELIFTENRGVQELWIIDDGKGMSLDDIKNKWIILGYSAKFDGQEDFDNRIYAGNKGIGRFSCDRLGSKLLMQCRKKGESKIHQVDIDWSLFEKDAKESFEQIDFDCEEIEHFELPKETKINIPSVVLKISSLRGTRSWGRDKLLNLRSNLEKLANPFSFADKSLIYITCIEEESNDEIATLNDEFASTVNGPIQNSIIEVIAGKSSLIEAKIKDGQLYTKLIDRGESIYEIKQPLDGPLERLKGSELEIRLYYLNRSAKATFTRRMGVEPVKYGSVMLFRNGFRVSPVGDIGDDFWKFERRKTQGYARFMGNRDLIGFVSVVGVEKDFKEASSRNQGLLETESVKDLKTVVLETLKRFESYVVKINWADKLDKDIETSERLSIDNNRLRLIELVKGLVDDDKVEVLSYNRDLVAILEQKSDAYEKSLLPLRSLADKTADSKLIAQVEKAEKVLKQLKKEKAEAEAIAESESEARKTAEEEAEKAKEALVEVEQRNLFLLSGSSRTKEQLEDFVHQMIYYASRSKIKSANLIRNYSDKKGDGWGIIVEGIRELREGFDKIMTVSRYLTSANFRMKSGKLTSQLSDFISEHMSKIVPLYNSRLEIKVQPYEVKFESTFSPIEMGMVFDNLVANATKARASKINVSLSVKDKSLEVIVSDDGKGIDDDLLPNKLFERGVTRTRGSGLGLHFCKKFIENIGGSISVISVENWSTSFKIVFVKT